MSADPRLWPYWSVDLYGLTEEGARDVVDHATTHGIVENGDPVDPGYFFTASLDQGTVRPLLAAIEVALRSDGLTPHDRVVVASMAEGYEEWLATAKPVEND